MVESQKDHQTTTWRANAALIVAVTALILCANAPDGIEARLNGDLAGVLVLSNDGGRKQKLPADGVAGSLLSLVAGAHNQRYLRLVEQEIPRIAA